VLAKQGRVVDRFADVIAAVAPQLAQRELLKPVTMTLFGMINWTFTWLKERGPVSYAQMAPVVTDLFLGGVLALPPSAPAAPPRRARRPAPSHHLAAPPPPVPDHLPRRVSRPRASHRKLEETSS
jgi:TetR/AcrR family transcriptional regulator